MSGIEICRFLYFFGQIDSPFTANHEQLAKQGLYPKEQEGLYERLLTCQVLADDGKCRLQFCRIWQWREEVLPEKKFLPYETYTAKYGVVRLEAYQVVYDGYVLLKSWCEKWDRHTPTPLFGIRPCFHNNIKNHGRVQ